MATPGGTVTQKDLFTEDAFKFGDPLVKEYEKVIAAQKKMTDGAKELSLVVNAYRKVENNQQFIEAKNAERIATEKVILGIKEEQAALVSAEKVKQETLRTEKLKYDSKKREQKEQQASIKLTIDERVANEQNNRIAKEQAILSSKITTAYTKLNLDRTIAKRTLLDLLSAENQNTEAIKKAEIEFEKLDVRVRKADQAVGDFHKSVGNYPKIANLTNGIKNLIGAFGVVGGIALFASILKNAFDTIKLFDQGLADLSAITGATGKDLEYLKNQAIELGKGVKGGAVSVVEAYKLIASAKPELLENVSALNQVTEAVLTLSQASGMEMPDAALALTDAMNQFGADASQAQIYIDALANGAKYGAAEIPQVTEALLKFGAVARASNVSIQESTALVELLAENGLKGADAGTALRNVLLKISAPDALPKKAQEEFSKLGISLETLKDKSIPIQEKLELLKPLLKDNASIVKIFGLENATAALNVLGHTDRLKELTVKMNENGTALDQANTRMDTLTGSVDLLESAWSSFVLNLSEKGNSGGAFLKFWVNDAIETLSMLDGWFTISEVKREKELAKIRKEGADSAIKNYSDKNKRSLEDLQNVIKWNDAEIAENTRLALKLEKVNKKIAADDSFFNSGKRKKQIQDNQQKIAELNNKTVFADAENKSVKGIIQSRTAKPVVDPTDPTVDSKTQDELAKKALDRAKKLSDSLYELKKQALERSIKINEDIATDELLNDEVRIKALEIVQAKQIALAELTKKHSLDADKFVLAENKMNANQKLFIANEAENKIVDIKKKTLDEISKINEFDTKDYEDNIKRGVSIIEIANNDKIAAEEKRFQDELALGYESDKAKENAAKAHERNLFIIKKEGLVAMTKLQLSVLASEIDAYETKAKEDGIITQKESDFILGKRKELSDLSVKLIQVEGDNFKENEKDKGKTAEEQTVQILEFSEKALGELADLSNAFSERKIQKIDNEIEKNNEYYDKQIELAGKDERQKDLLQKERDKKNAELEKKKKEAQNKQAKVDKAVAIAQATINTALAVMKGFSESGYVGAILAGVLGAISIATIIATPIPKYKDGRKGGPAELAYVGDGGRHEIIERASGSIEMTPKTDTLVKLLEGDKVHSSVDEYQRYLRASILSNISLQNGKMNDYQAGAIFDIHNKELLDELKRNTRAIEKNKSSVTVNTPKLDINHHLWKMKNTNWNN